MEFTFTRASSFWICNLSPIHFEPGLLLVFSHAYPSLQFQKLFGILLHRHIPLSGRPPLVMQDTLFPLCLWLEDHDFFYLRDYAFWGSRGDWKGWKALSPPSNLLPTYDAFKSYLHGIAPLNHRVKDSRGWGKTGIYTLKDGYHYLQSTRNKPCYSKWSNLWNSDNIPKINSFFGFWLRTSFSQLIISMKRGIQFMYHSRLYTSMFLHSLEY